MFDFVVMASYDACVSRVILVTDVLSTALMLLGVIASVPPALCETAWLVGVIEVGLSVSVE